MAYFLLPDLIESFQNKNCLHSFNLRTSSKGEISDPQHYQSTFEFITSYMTYFEPLCEQINHMEDFEFLLIVYVDEQDFEHIMCEEFNSISPL